MTLAKTMTVSTGPSAVRLTASSNISTEDSTTNLSCVAERVEPFDAAHFAWQIGGEKIPQKDLSFFGNQSPDFGESSPKTVLSIEPTYQHHGQIVSCHVENRESGVKMNETFQLIVRYAPRIDCDVEEHAADFRVGCRVNAFPRLRPDDVEIRFSEPEFIASSTSFQNAAAAAKTTPATPSTTPMKVTKATASDGAVLLNFTRSKGVEVQRFEVVVSGGDYAGAKAALKEFNLTRTAAPPKEPMGANVSLSTNELVVIIVAAVIVTVLIVVALLVLCRKKPKRRGHDFAKAAAATKNNSVGYKLREHPDKSHTLETGDGGDGTARP